MEFISRNGKEQDNVGDIYEEQTVGTKVGVEYLVEQVNEVFNEFLKEKAMNTCPLPSGVGHGEVKGKEADADISK
jgi:hypothetical protein